jgi:hypothetical protein
MLNNLKEQKGKFETKTFQEIEKQRERETQQQLIELN